MDYTALNSILHFSAVHITLHIALFVKELSVVRGVIEIDAGCCVEAPQPGVASSTPLTIHGNYFV